jgi:hypothetical protein
MITNTQISSTTTTQLFLSSGQNAVTTIFFCNVTTGTNATVNVYVVPSGRNANASTQIMNALSLPAGETFVLDTERLILENGDAISAQVSNTNAITTTVSSVSTQ